MKTQAKNTHVRLRSETYDRLKAISEKRLWSMATVVDEAIKCFESKSSMKCK